MSVTGLAFICTLISSTFPECLDPVVSCASVNPKEMDSLLEMVEDFQTKKYQKLLKPNLDMKFIDPECQDLFKDVLAVMESYLCQTMRPIVDAFRYYANTNNVSPLSVILLCVYCLSQERKSGPRNECSPVSRLYIVTATIGSHDCPAN